MGALFSLIPKLKVNFETNGQERCHALSWTKLEVDTKHLSCVDTLSLMIDTRRYEKKNSMKHPGSDS